MDGGILPYPLPACWEGASIEVVCSFLSLPDPSSKVSIGRDRIASEGGNLRCGAVAREMKADVEEMANGLLLPWDCSLVQRRYI